MSAVVDVVQITLPLPSCLCCAIVVDVVLLLPATELVVLSVLLPVAELVVLLLLMSCYCCIGILLPSWLGCWLVELAWLSAVGSCV